ncbi:MAG: orotate phosphoribosyltransferase [Bacteroidetes bacterium]|nr:orotate phosphoribosyltransferase [Bacteroidota bacterium]
MIYNKETAFRTAELLLQIKAIKLDVDHPFTWASGIISPIYCDNRVTLSYPRVRTYIRQEFVKAIQSEYGDVDLIAGVATGGIAQGVLVAQDLDLPFAYVRASKKGHGLENQIEGRVEAGQSVVVLEDLISTGGSSLSAVDALRQAGCNVKGMVAIFTYNLQKATNAFLEHKCSLLTLSDYDHLIQKAIEIDYIRSEDYKTLLKWRENPSEWGK